MDTSFQTPLPFRPPIVSTGQLFAVNNSDHFIEDLFGPTPTGGQILSATKSHSSRRSTRDASPSSSRSFILPPGLERQGDSIFWIRLSTIAVTVAIQGLHLPGFSVLDFQLAAMNTFRTLRSMTQDSALLPLLVRFFRVQTACLDPSIPFPAAFADTGQSLNPFDPPALQLRPDDFFSRHSNASFTSFYSNVTSQPDNDVARLLAFQAKYSILTATDADAIRAFLQSWMNYKGTGILSMIACIGADARTVLELVYFDQLYRGLLNPSSK